MILKIICYEGKLKREKNYFWPPNGAQGLKLIKKGNKQISLAGLAHIDKKTLLKNNK